MFGFGSYKLGTIEQMLQRSKSLNIFNPQAWHKLAEILQASEGKIQLKKTKRGRGLNAIAHNCARKGLHCRYNRSGFYWLKEGDSGEFAQIKYKDIPRADIKIKLPTT